MTRTLPSESWTEMCERIERAKGLVAWRWAATCGESGAWNLVALMVEVGKGASLSFDRYQSAVIAVEELSAEVAAGRMREGRVSASDADMPGLSLPAQGNVVPQWIYSSEAWPLTESGWPRLVVNAGAGNSAYVDAQQPLQAARMPFYPSLGAAVAEKVFCVPPAQVRVGQHAPVSVQIVDRRGHISGVEASADEVHLAVQEGDEDGLRGFALRVAWRDEPDSREWSRSDYELKEPGTVEVSTGGIPAELVAVLVDEDGSEIDRRSWDEQFDRPVEEPESLEGLVARWLGEGEHGQLEYKQTLKDEKTRVSFAETVAAFANGAGGAVLVGVDDSGAAVGYDATKASDQVTNIIAHRVDEPPNFAVDEVRIEGKPLVVVRVSPSAPQRRPHQVNGQVMVRAMATTRPATPGQVRELTSVGEPRIEGLL